MCHLMDIFINFSQNSIVTYDKTESSIFVFLLVFNEGFTEVDIEFFYYTYKNI